MLFRSRYSPGFYHFSVLTPIRPLFGIRPDNFFDTHPDSTIFRYSHSFEPFLVLVRTLFRYSHGFYLFPVLVGSLPFFCTRTYSIPFRYSPGQFFDTRTDSTISRYSPGFFHFSVHTVIRPFSRTRRDTFSILARILPFPGTHLD